MVDFFSSVTPRTRLIVLAASPLAAGLGFYQVAVPVFLPLQGISVTNLGIMLTTLGLATVLLSIPFAVLSDRFGRKGLMSIGAFLASFFLMIPGLTSDFLWLEASAIVGGTAEAMFLSTWNAYLADATDQNARPATFSLSFVTFTMSYGVGSLLPGVFPFTALDLVEAHKVAFVLLGLLALLTPYSLIRWAVHRKPTVSRRGILPRKSMGIIAKFSASNMMIGLGAGLIIPLIPTWFYLRYGLTDVFSGPLVAVSSVLMGSAAAVSPNIAKRIGLVKGIVSTQILSTVFLFLIPLSPSALMAAPLYVTRSMLMNMSSPLADTFLMNLIAEDERATASAFNVIIWRVPNAASTLLGASLLNSGELELPFFLCTLLYVFSITLFYALFRKTT